MEQIFNRKKAYKRRLQFVLKYHFHRKSDKVTWRRKNLNPLDTLSLKQT
jgi:hypothetical protein